MKRSRKAFTSSYLSSVLNDIRQSSPFNEDVSWKYFLHNNYPWWIVLSIFFFLLDLWFMNRPNKFVIYIITSTEIINTKCRWDEGHILSCDITCPGVIIIHRRNYECVFVFSYYFPRLFPVLEMECRKESIEITAEATSIEFGLQLEFYPNIIFIIPIL